LFIYPETILIMQKAMKASTSTAKRVATKIWKPRGLSLVAKLFWKIVSALFRKLKNKCLI